MQYHPVALGGHRLLSAGTSGRAGWRCERSRVSCRHECKVRSARALRAVDDASVTDLEKTRSKLSNMTSPGLYLELLNLF